MNKAFVTGATGLVGFNIVRALCTQGRQVKASVRSIDKARRLLPSTVELVQGDVTELESIVSGMQDCSVVYHVAGLPEQWLADNIDFRRVNVEGTENTIEAALQNRVDKFIYVSTVDVFREEATGEYDENAVDVEPKQTPYQRSKQDADKKALDALCRGLPVVFIHPAAVYGPGPSSSQGLNRFIYLVADRRVPMMVPPGSLPVVFSKDVARGCLLAEEKGAIGSRYILSESTLGLKDVARAVSEELGWSKVPKVMPFWLALTIATVGEWGSQIVKKPPLIHKGQLIALQRSGRPRNDKAIRELDWKPTSFAQGIAETLAFRKEALNNSL
jgi:nucleoside-diphosphate-sugar epimerase